MNITYLLTSIVIFLGLPLGIILAYIGKEIELKPGKPYFIFLQSLFLVLILVFLLFAYHINLIFTAFLALLLLGLLYFLKLKYETVLIYPLLAIIIYLSNITTKLFMIQAALIFLYGFPTGSLLINLKKPNWIKIILLHSPFLIISIILSFF